MSRRNGKRSRKKILFSFFAALLIGCVSLLSGCHGSRPLQPFSVPAELDREGQYELVFWAKNDTNNNQTAVYRSAIEQFEALYPNVTVTLRLYTDYGRIYNDVITNLSTGTTPHICITYPDHIATYLSGASTVVPLDALLDDPLIGLSGSEVSFDAPAKEEIVPEFLEEGKIGGVSYALPFMRSTEALYVNETFVNALGYELPERLTWDFIWEVADKAAEKDAEGNYVLNGQKVMIPFIYKSTDNMMIQMLHQRKADYVTGEGEILLFNEETKDILYEVAEHTAKGAFSTFKISSYPANFLNAGQCVFAIDSTAGATWMGPEAPLLDIAEDKIVPFEIAVRTLPQENTEDISMISQGPSVCVFNKPDPQEVAYAWLFAAFLLTDDVQIGYSTTEGYVPVTLKAQRSKTYQEYLALEGADGEAHYAVKIQAAKLLLSHMEDTFVTPVFSGSASVRDAAGQLVENVTKSVRRGETVDEAYMQHLFEEVSALYRLGEGSPAGQERSIQGEELPAESKILLGSLLGIWVMLGAGWLVRVVKAAKEK